MQPHMKEHDTIIADLLNMRSFAAKIVHAYHNLKPTDNVCHTIHAIQVQITVKM